MFKCKILMTGMLSGILLLFTPLATTASADSIDIGFDITLDRLTYDDGEYRRDYPRRSREYQGTRYYNEIPVRRIHRQLRKRGLFAISEFRIKRNRVIIRAENRRGAVYKVVASVRNGNIIALRRIHDPVYQPRYRTPDYYDYDPAVSNPYWDDNRRGYRDYSRPRYKTKRLTNPDKRINRKKHRRNRDVRRVNRKNVVNRDPARVSRKTIRKVKKPYIDQSAEDYERWKNGSGK